MDAWIIALRGDAAALLAARTALAIAPSEADGLHVFVFDTVDPATAARLLAQAVAAAKSLAGGVALAGTDGEPEARARAIALACAAPAGEVLVDAAARTRLAGELLYVRPRTRPGWTLPVTAVALAPDAPLRAACRDGVAYVPAAPRIVARAREIAAIVGAAAQPGPIVVRAAAGMGGGRLIAEAAARAGRSIERLPQAALADADLLWSAVEAAREADWLVVDPVPPTAVPLLPQLAANLPHGRLLVIRVAPDAPIDFVPASRQITLGPLREYDACGIVRALLGDAADEAVVRRLARRGGGAPRGLVEAVRAAVQLGELQRDAEGAWRARARRVLRPRGAPTDALAARVADLPARLRQALEVLAVVGDGARTVEGVGALRGAVAHAPGELLTTLSAAGFIERSGGRFYLAASLRALVPAEDERVLALASSGALAAGARAEASMGAGRRHEAAQGFAAAADAALRHGLTVAAVRYVAAAQVQDDAAPDVREAMRAVAAVLGPAVVIQPLTAAGAPSTRPRALSPEALEQAAAEHTARQDLEGAARLRTLAEILRGNSQRALRLVDAAEPDGTSRGLLVAALAQAAAGRAPLAVRTTLAALAGARRADDAPGEAAALSLLSTLYRALGRDEDAQRLAERARRKLPASASA